MKQQGKLKHQYLLRASERFVRFVSEADAHSFRVTILGVQPTLDSHLRQPSPLLMCLGTFWNTGGGVTPPPTMTRRQNDEGKCENMKRRRGICSFRRRTGFLSKPPVWIVSRASKARNISIPVDSPQKKKNWTVTTHQDAADLSLSFFSRSIQPRKN